MTELPVAKVSVHLQRQWTAREQLADLTPATGVAALLTWSVDPHPVDAAVPDVVKCALASVLTRHGELAFHWASDTWPGPGEAAVHPAPRRSAARQLVERLSHCWPSAVVVTRSAAAAACLFDQDWDMQGQAALLIAVTGPRDSLLADLATRRDWSSFDFPPPALALLAPAVDGYGALLATAGQPLLDQLLAELADAFRAPATPPHSSKSSSLGNG